MQLKCKFCSKIFSKKRNLKYHQASHSEKRRYKCDQCEKTFIRSQELKLHKNSHMGIKPFSCHLCPKQFSQSPHLKSHVRTHTGEKPYKCDLCPKRFTQSSHLKSHQLHHTGEKPFKCEKCGDAFRLPSTLKCHMRRHTGEKPYKCHVCGMAFSQTTPLYHHLQKHSGKLPFRCRYCGRGFGIRKSCEDHEKTVCRAGGRRRYKCVFCGDRCYTKKDFDKHIRRHIGETPYFCRFCDLCFFTWKARKYHMRIHLDFGEPLKDKPFKCSMCHHSFKEEERYKRHLNQNHLERKTDAEEGEVAKVKSETGGRFPCEHCNQSFKEKKELKDHLLNVHLIRKIFEVSLVSSVNKTNHSRSFKGNKFGGEGGTVRKLKRNRKPFECKQCEKSFRAESSLNLHFRIVHDGVEAKNCLFCWKSFPAEARLQDHLKLEHGKSQFKSLEGVQTNCELKISVVKQEKIILKGMEDKMGYKEMASAHMGKRDGDKDLANNIHEVDHSIGNLGTSPEEQMRKLVSAKLKQNGNKLTNVQELKTDPYLTMRDEEVVLVQNDMKSEEKDVAAVLERVLEVVVALQMENIKF